MGSPELHRTADGIIVEDSHHVPPSQRTNPYSAGPFCRFGLPAAPSAPGVYAVFVNDQLVYIGRCENLASRFGPGGYGRISPRNIHDDGQSTNCKLNSRILIAVNDGSTIQVWFHSTSAFVSVEAELINRLKPEWNGRSPKPPSPTRVPKEANKKVKTPSSALTFLAKIPDREDFDRELQILLHDASARGLLHVEISAGQVHKLAGAYPGRSHRMPVCCARMRAAMRNGDKIAYAPPKGNGARLTIEYLLPR